MIVHLLWPVNFWKSILICFVVQAVRVKHNPLLHQLILLNGQQEMVESNRLSKTPKLIFSSPKPVSKPLMKPNRTFEEEKIKQKESLPAKFLGIFFYFLMYR